MSRLLACHPLSQHICLRDLIGIIQFDRVLEIEDLPNASVVGSDDHDFGDSIIQLRLGAKR